MGQFVPTMLTVKSTFERLKSLNPDTEISQWFIRCLCKENKVKHFMTGKKILVNFEDLLRFLNNQNDID